MHLLLLRPKRRIPCFGKFYKNLVYRSKNVFFSSDFLQDEKIRKIKCCYFSTKSDLSFI